jgi:hypothetical protein
MTGRAVAYAACTALVVVAFAGSGLANLLRIDHVASDMAHLGYPAYVMTVLGTWKVLGAVAVAVPGLPRAKEWAYAGMIFDLGGAAASRAAIGDRVETAIIPLAIASLVAGSWALRPPGRTLPAAPAPPPRRTP